MALTTLQGNYALNTMRSLFRPLIHIFGESEIAALPYAYNRYIFDIYVNGTMILREFKAITIGDNSTVYAYLDASKVIQNYIQANISSMYLPYIEYQVKYGTEDLSGNLITNLETDTSIAWYGYPSILNNDLTLDAGGSYYDALYLTTNPNRILTNYGLYNTYVPIFKSPVYYTGLVQFNVNGGGLVNEADSANNGVYNHILTGGDLNPALNSFNIKYYVDGDVVHNMNNSEVRLVTDCTKNNPVMIHFLNALGGMESFLFTGVNRVNTNIERNSINKLGLTTTLTAYEIYRNVQIDRSYNDIIAENKVNYNNTMTHKMRLVSDYISETDFLWLRQLLASPMVYAQIDNNVTLLPVTIETSDWAEKKRGADKIFNLEIDILLGTQSSQIR
jgi:hypothetical protein